ncbi:MAG: hypothetical protein EB076_09530, partial [Flavobacteriia bacterium]|nr:hypothetical protein [Flavobacteriia bacterium]
MDKKLWLFVVVLVSALGVGFPSMAEITINTQATPVLEGFQSLVLFIPTFCVGIFLTTLITGDTGDRFLAFSRGAFALVAALQAADTPEFKQYFFQTADALFLRKLAIATLPLVALFIPILLCFRESYRFFFFKIFVLFSCLAIAIALFSLPDTTLLTIHLICIALCLCSLTI